MGTREYSNGGHSLLQMAHGISIHMAGGPTLQVKWIVLTMISLLTPKNAEQISLSKRDFVERAFRYSTSIKGYRARIFLSESSNDKKIIAPQRIRALQRSLRQPSPLLS